MDHSVASEATRPEEPPLVPVAAPAPASNLESPAPERPATPSHVARASRLRLALEVLVSIAVIAFFVTVLVIDNSNRLVWFLLLSHLPVLWKEFRKLRRPAHFEVGDGLVAFQGDGNVWSSPIGNVADVRRLDGGVLVTFFDPELVLPESLQPKLKEARQKSGVHLELRAPFDRRTIEGLSERLPATVAGAWEVDPRIVALTRPVAVVPALVGLNVVLFAAMVLVSWDLKTLLLPDVPDLVAWGGQVSPLALTSEPWRLLTSTFVHVGGVHLLLNAWALLFAGATAERLLGRAGLVATYLLSGLGGSIAAAVSSPGVVLCGASGAIFGLFGSLLAYVWRQGSTLPPATTTKLKFVTLICVVLSFLLDASVTFISQSAHIGGFVTGFVVALPLVRPLGEAGFRQPLLRSLAVLAAGLGLIAVALPQARDRARDTVEWVRGSAIAFGLIEERLSDEVGGISKSDRVSEPVIKLIEGEILPRWKAARSLIEESPGARSPTPEVAAARRAARIWADARQFELECVLSRSVAVGIALDRCHGVDAARAEAWAEFAKLLKRP